MGPTVPNSTHAGSDTPQEQPQANVEATEMEGAALSPSTMPIVPPTSSRSLRGQTSRSFSKGKETAAPAPGSSATPIIAPSDIQALTRVGMTPAASGESAQGARGRHNENEARVATFITNLENVVAMQGREHSDRLQELTLLVRNVSSTCEKQIHSPAVANANLVDNPVVQELRSVVIEDRNRITEMGARITDMANEIRHLRSDSGDSRRPPSIPPIPTLPPVSYSHPKRPVEDYFTTGQAKRARSSQNPNPDVIYGPVDTDGNPKTIACAAMEQVPGLHPNDVFSAKYTHQQGYISVRFRNHESADRFMESMDVDPLYEGQTATPAGPGTAGAISRQTSRLTPREIILGVGKNPRRR
jgi:hypothetical protein